MPNFLDRNKKIFLFFAGFLFLLNIFCWKEVFYLAENHNLRVNFFDVGQGDAAFIITPENHKILIDGGPSSAVIGKLAKELPFWDRKIDLVILTHPELDHMSGIIDVLQRYKVDYFLWTGILRETPEYKRLTGILNPEKTKIATASSGEIVKAGNVLIDILYPLENLAGKEIKNTSNDTGIVSKLIYGRKSFLFAADIDMAGEREIINSGENILSDVLKVAHHGSKYSTSDIFLKNVKPEIAVVSVGKNSYGHPTPETLQRLKKFGIKVLRTDANGDVKMESDGNEIKIQ